MFRFKLIRDKHKHKIKRKIKKQCHFLEFYGQNNRRKYQKIL